MKKLIWIIISYFLSLGLIHGQSQELQYFKLTDTVFYIGSIYQLPDIQLNFDNDWFPNEKFKCLDSTIAFLKFHPEISVEIGYHTDMRPITMTNDSLSAYRAKDIVNYLELNGIEPKRLTAKGYGSRSSFQLTEDIKIKGLTFKKGRF